MTHNKNKKPLFFKSLYLLINCISARPTPQMLSLEDEYTFHF